MLLKLILFRKDGNVLFIDTLNTFYLWLYGVRHMVKDHSDSKRGNPLPPHGLLFPISRQDNTYHGLSYTSCGALAGLRNRSMGPLWRIALTTHRSMSGCSYHSATSRSCIQVESKRYSKLTICEILLKNGLVRAVGHVVTQLGLGHLVPCVERAHGQLLRRVLHGDKTTNMHNLASNGHTASSFVELYPETKQQTCTI